MFGSFHDVQFKLNPFPSRNTKQYGKSWYAFCILPETLKKSTISSRALYARRSVQYSDSSCFKAASGKTKCTLHKSLCKSVFCSGAPVCAHSSHTFLQQSKKKKPCLKFKHTHTSRHSPHSLIYVLFSPVVCAPPHCFFPSFKLSAASFLRAFHLSVGERVNN